MRLLVYRQSGQGPSDPAKSQLVGPVGTFFAGLFVFVFVAAFIAMGLAFTWFYARDLARSYAMRSWEETPARVLSAKLAARHTSREGVILEAQADYEYRFAGVMHKSSRVSHGGVENFGSFQRDAYELLDEHLKSGQPILCYVNPQDPSDAILFRDLRPQTFVISIPAITMAEMLGLGAPLLIAVQLLRWRRGQLFRRRAIDQHPDEPWLWREDWARGVIDSSDRLPIVWIMLAVFWNVAALPAWLFLPQAARGNTWALIDLGWVIVGGVLAWQAISRAVRRRRYLLHISENPATPGGRLVGQLETNAPAGVVAACTLELRCLSGPTPGGKGTNLPAEETLWQTRQHIPPTFPGPDFGSITFPIDITIPRDCLPTSSEENPQQRIAWRLYLIDTAPNTNRSGPPLAAEFDVPVFVAQRNPTAR